MPSEARTDMRFVLDLDGDETHIVRLLRHLLKVLGRVHGVRCKSVSATTEK
jgi:hypothetical protein